MCLKKIISGGQTGAEIAGIDAAIENGLPYGGWLAEERRTENGPLDSKYTNMMELEDADFPDKTEQNVKDADGTAIFSHGKLSGDTSLAHGFARIHHKPVLHLDMNELSETEAIESSIEWIYRNKIEILNVTGSPESKDEYIYDDVHSTIKSIITTIKTAEIYHAQHPSSPQPSLHKAVFAHTPQPEITMAESEKNEFPDAAEEREPVPSPVEYFPGARQKSFLYIASGILVLILVLFVIARMHQSSETTATKPRPSPEEQVAKTTGSSSQNPSPQAATAEPQKASASPAPADSSSRPGVQPASSETAMSEGAKAKVVENKPEAAAGSPPLAAKPQETAVNAQKKEHEDGADATTSPDYGEKHGIAQSLSDTSEEDKKIETSPVAVKKVPTKSRYSCGALYKKISLGQVLDKAESDFLAKNCH